MDKKTYPVKDGWLHAKVKYTPGTVMSADTMLAFFCCNSETHEVAKFTAFKTCANLIFRRKPKYYLLQEGEEILEGDECEVSNTIHDPARWVPAGNTVGQKAPSPLYIAHRKYRRLIPE